MSKRGLAARVLDSTGCNRLFQLAPSWRGLLVLNYHRIGDGRRSPLDRNLYSATTEDFDRQVRCIQRDFDLIGLNDLELALHSRRGRSVMITFDDGYLDNYTEAFAVLRQRRAVATFFITTGFIDIPQTPWWDEIAWMVRHSPLSELPENPWTGMPVRFDEPDRSRAIHRLLSLYKRLGSGRTADYLADLSQLLNSGRCPEQIGHELWMTWPMLREMQQCGMSIGGHTVSHPVLANLSPAEQDAEIGNCRRRLQEQLGASITAFSYPVGGRSSFDAVTEKAVARHGFRWAFTYEGGHIATPACDPLALPRAAVESEIDLPLFRAMLTLPQWFA